MNKNIDYIEFVKSYLSGSLHGLFFLHLDDGCRSSLAKLSYIEAKCSGFSIVTFNPELEGHSVDFALEHFIDLPCIMLFGQGEMIQGMDGLVWPYEIKEIERMAREKGII